MRFILPYRWYPLPSLRMTSKDRFTISSDNQWKIGIRQWCKFALRGFA